MEFKRKEVAEKYDLLAGKDHQIIIPALYKGALSNVTLTAANRMCRTKSNLLKEKNPKMKTRENSGGESRKRKAKSQKQKSESQKH